MSPSTNGREWVYDIQYDEKKQLLGAQWVGNNVITLARSSCEWDRRQV